MERGDRARAGPLQKPRRRSDRQEQTFVTSGQLRRGRRRALRVNTADFDVYSGRAAYVLLVWRSVHAFSGTYYPE